MFRTYLTQLLYFHTDILKLMTDPIVQYHQMFLFLDITIFMHNNYQDSFTFYLIFLSGIFSREIPLQD